VLPSRRLTAHNARDVLHWTSVLWLGRRSQIALYSACRVDTQEAWDLPFGKVTWSGNRVREIPKDIRPECSERPLRPAVMSLAFEAASSVHARTSPPPIYTFQLTRGM
jgi:hypothetical protein